MLKHHNNGSNAENQEDLKQHSLGELFKELSEETTILLRKELQLAQAELTEKGRRAGRGAGLFGGAGVIGLLALGALTACFIAALATAMPTWLAALIVTVVYGIAAGVLAMQGKEKISEAGSPMPEQTVETLKEDAQWAKNQVSSGTR